VTVAVLVTLCMAFSAQFSRRRIETQGILSNQGTEIVKKCIKSTPPSIIPPSQPPDFQANQSQNTRTQSNCPPLSNSPQPCSSTPSSSSPSPPSLWLTPSPRNVRPPYHSSPIQLPFPLLVNTNTGDSKVGILLKRAIDLSKFTPEELANTGKSSTSRFNART